jgi:hypothetical protein
MSRDLTANMVTQVTAAALSPVYFMELDLPSGALRLWNGIGPITWNSQTWTGVASLISFSPIKETQAIEAHGIKFVLNGISSAILSAVLDNSNELQRATVTLYMGALDSSGAVVADPFNVFSGYADTCEIEDTGETAKITLNAESKLIALKRTKVRRYTPEDQKQEYSGDLFFDFVPALQDQEIQWGKGQE